MLRSAYRRVAGPKQGVRRIRMVGLWRSATWTKLFLAKAERMSCGRGADAARALAICALGL